MAPTPEELCVLKTAVPREFVQQLKEVRTALSHVHPEEKIADLLGECMKVCLPSTRASRRAGQDRLHLWRVVWVSAAELQTPLQLAEAWGHLDSVTLDPVRAPSLVRTRLARQA